MSDLTPTARVILGMIRLGKRTGYEIKQLVDISTRFFWTASYGQIYPELKRLEEGGLITGEPDPAGGRARTVYTLTPAGEAALEAWLDSRDQLVWELRDESLLKLFFSGERDRDALREHMREAGRRSAEMAERLRALAPDLDDPDPGPMMTLRFGIELNEWMADWWARAEERAGRPADPRRR
ncbi:MAG TPA: PadR family transcriptional regulator [Thermoleophilaceae bacterium]|jgi:DNA-binding PadR family transcriptional regulator